MKERQKVIGKQEEGLGFHEDRQGEGFGCLKDDPRERERSERGK